MKMKVSVTRDHPTGSRYRAGLAFGRKVSIVDVTEEQAAAILADPYLASEAVKAKDTVVVTELPPEEQAEAPQTPEPKPAPEPEKAPEPKAERKPRKKK
jgi:outer membrane biosynthesis protein TonB